ncbi:hypothetical protein CYPRO_1976 [Cyclonatronum proteinivorum]|uniref:Uncharacterized protein n=1 Tax=Cyclonatronum proteinivorum TaxID=1457365 RepID=A0A345UL74_9BACT|nr:hypothetical protein CYPRO_1976 [Cyclonatronum proteinivorum]
MIISDKAGNLILEFVCALFLPFTIYEVALKVTGFDQLSHTPPRNLLIFE